MAEAVKVAIVTGGSRGIGRAAALKLGAAGYTVVVNYTANEAAANDVAKAITAAGGKAVAVKGDVAKEADILALFAAADKLGPLNFGGGQHEIFLGRDFTQHREISEDTARMIDAEVHEFVMRNYRKAKAAIESHKDQLVTIAEALLVRETLDGNDIEILMKGGTLPPPKPGATPTAPATVEEGPSTDPGLNPALKPA